MTTSVEVGYYKRSVFVRARHIFRVFLISGLGSYSCALGAYDMNQDHVQKNTYGGVQVEPGLRRHWFMLELRLVNVQYIHKQSS